MTALTGHMTPEPTFTASEVQAAIEAVILYERARCERLLHGASASVDAIARAARHGVSTSRHRMLNEIIREANAS